MTFDNIPSGTSIFIDANCFVYEAIDDPKYGASCKRLLDRIDNHDLVGYTSSHMLAEMAHRLITIEVSVRLPRTLSGMANWLRRHPTEIQKCTSHQSAISELNSIPINILPITGNHISLAADVIIKLGLLVNDAIVVVIMEENGLQNLASLDTDFDKVPGILRHTPI